MLIVKSPGSVGHHPAGKGGQSPPVAAHGARL